MMVEIQDIHMFKRKLLRVTMFRMMLETFIELFELRKLLQMFNATIAVRRATMLVIVQSQELGIQIGDDQVDSNIIFEEPNEDVNSSSVENDNNIHDSYELEQLARNGYKEAEKQQINAKKVPQQNIMLTK
nr:hypothetical protein [Tanacetum cinerariifolium]